MLRWSSVFGGEPVSGSEVLPWDAPSIPASQCSRAAMEATAGPTGASAGALLVWSPLAHPSSFTWGTPLSFWDSLPRSSVQPQLPRHSPEPSEPQGVITGVPFL
ncbi:hypothetical protein Y1Q_0008024 [Alligator mississippiensis]|uniref:Uncharacterized protein n=1 Tax=Alligator mississippiensis TaxID=8496 RepID=A0A151NF86_ALLMI|nr:hypothetical protein Y1Q_0008024 [Alligator mississippiensis]